MTSEPEVTSSPVVATVLEHLLSSIHDGTLQPGDRISDSLIAKEFNISRTPVREAIQKLRELGLIEASANRFTRVSIITPAQTLDAMAVWMALYSLLAASVAGDVTDEIVDALEADADAFAELVPDGDYLRIANANYNFYLRLMPLTSNAILVTAISNVVHIVRMGSQHLPSAINYPRLSHWHRELVSALRARDPEAARLAVLGLREITIPQ